MPVLPFQSHLSCNLFRSWLFSHALITSAGHASSFIVQSEVVLAVYHGDCLSLEEEEESSTVTLRNTRAHSVAFVYGCFRISTYACVLLRVFNTWLYLTLKYFQLSTINLVVWFHSVRLCKCRPALCIRDRRHKVLLLILVQFSCSKTVYLVISAKMERRWGGKAWRWRGALKEIVQLMDVLENGSVQENKIWWL